MYRVTEYLGDYQLPDQLFWDEKFTNLLAAEFVAEKVYSRRAESEGESGAYYVLIETVDESGLGDLVKGWNCFGTLTGDELEKFVAKFE